jgi:hypothetical protein
MGVRGVGPLSRRCKRRVLPMNDTPKLYEITSFLHLKTFLLETY